MPEASEEFEYPDREGNVPGLFGNRRAEGQRVADTTSLWISKLGSSEPTPRHQRTFFPPGDISWAKRRYLLPLPLHSQLLPVMVSCPPTGQTPAGRVTWKRGDKGRSAHCLPYPRHSQTVGTLSSLVGSPGSCHHPRLRGAFPVFDGTGACAVAPVLSHVEVRAPLFTFLPPTCCLGAGSSAKPRPSLNGTRPSRMHFHYSCQNTPGKKVSRDPMKAICRGAVTN